MHTHPVSFFFCFCLRLIIMKITDFAKNLCFFFCLLSYVGRYLFYFGSFFAAYDIFQETEKNTKMLGFFKRPEKFSLVIYSLCVFFPCFYCRSYFLFVFFIVDCLLDFLLYESVRLSFYSVY